MGGSSFYEGPYGNVMSLKGKSKKKKCYDELIAAGVDPQSAAHDCNQLEFTAGGWTGLTIVQKNQWNTIALTITFFNRFGDPYNPSGFLVYMQWNLKRARAGVPAISVPAPLLPAPTGFIIVWGTAVAGGQIGRAHV